MMKPRSALALKVLVLSSFFLLGASSACAINNWTVRIDPYMNISFTGPKENLSIMEGDSFNMSLTAYCFNASCGRTTLHPLYCEGHDCLKFVELDQSYSSGLYTKDEVRHVCRIMDGGMECEHTWSMIARRVGRYSLLMSAEVELIDGRFISDVFYITVIGCGDGNCSEEESYDRCPADCCESDCTSFYDDVCHKRCGGYNGCAFAQPCDGKPVNYTFCQTPESFVSCCSIDDTSCDREDYCVDGICESCSPACDGVCDSVACFGVDPDCDFEGNATRECCGNSILDEGEECDGELSSACEHGCSRYCKCVIPTTRATTTRRTTTSRTTSTSTTTQVATVKVEDYLENLKNGSNGTSGEGVEGNGSAGEQDPSMGVPQELLLAGVTILVVLVVFSVLGFLGYRVWDKRRALRDFEVLKKRRDSLKEAMADVMLDYSLKKITLDESSRQVYKYEKELTEVEKKLSAVRRKMKSRKKNPKEGKDKAT